MKPLNINTLLGFSLAIGLACSPALEAADFDFHIDLNTAALTTAANGPFFLDLQLNEGSGSLANTVTLSHFTFDGGNAVGSPTSFGNIAGDLSSVVSLNDSPASPFNEFFEVFSAGTTSIHFDASVSQNSPGATPDGFFVAILDSETDFPQISTTAPDGVSLVALNIGTANTLADVSVFNSTSPAGVSAAAASPVPEASSMAAVMGGFAVLLSAFRYFSRRRVRA